VVVVAQVNQDQEVVEHLVVEMVDLDQVMTKTQPQEEPSLVVAVEVVIITAQEQIVMVVQD
tara:strand:- start:49 stop:231 length:183 start_codon:yes stop_codon:yes gene_type:complete